MPKTMEPDLSVLPPFPFQAKLIKEPVSQYARDNMTVGHTYTVHKWAGSCVVVSTNESGDTTMIHWSSIEPCKPVLH